MLRGGAATTAGSAGPVRPGPSSPAGRNGTFARAEEPGGRRPRPAPAEEASMTRRTIPPQDRLWLELDRPTNLLVIT
ncbi:hypothetical protein [Pseudonocardia abyssalis]|uniref:Uncharacterized protein n=1 Tax=Pseudonocardia abyssalis TaxID=2792008 RepID=A0ABS6UNH7_9PSEU|nr:hypothetical protein [Pseudonocardia abyssalis]MBW0133801.1 hypothetical protein [Pseudonocardia abyssalis]